MAQQLIEQRLAACANILPQVQSIYRWEGVLEEATEITLLIKTTRERYADLEAAILSMHPFQVPEIIVLPIEHGYKPYLDWIAFETKKDVDV